MSTIVCDGCTRHVEEAETRRVAGQFHFCEACTPWCCVCHHSARDYTPQALDDWRVNGFRLNNRQFICGRCRWKPT